MKTRILLLLAVLVGMSALRARDASAQALSFSGTLASDTALVLDSNNPCVDGPRSGYVAFQLTNNGATRNGIYVELNGFANGLSLSANQASRQYIGTWAGGAVKTLYWFIAYPCTFGSASNLSAHIVESSTGISTDITKRVVTTSMLSSNGGGQLVAGSAGPGAVVGQVLTVDVQYQFGGVSAGDTYSLQASGTIALNAQCFQLVKTEIVQSDIPAVPVGATDQMFFTATARQSGSGFSTTMRYYK